MTEYLKTKNEITCYGCRACEQICPKGAISVVQNSEGFLYPTLSENECVECGLCAAACPYGASDSQQGTPIKVFAGQYNDSESLLLSSSGGIFSALSDYVLEQGGYISGCLFDENFIAFHDVTNKKRTVTKMRGSKYVQSDTRDVFSRIKTLLSENKKILFTGTPCQVDGLKKFLRGDCENLFTVDLICHGAPSSLILSRYLDTERKKRGEITELTFRNKKRNGWSARGSIGSGKKVKSTSFFNDSFYNLYLQNAISRSSCYECKYADKVRVGDISIGDFWGVEEAFPEMNFEKGVSAVLVNTERGLKLLDALKSSLVLCETDFETAAKNNGNLSAPSNKPKIRNFIYEEVERDGYTAVAKRYCRYQYIRPLLRRLIPKKLKRGIKKLLKRS